MAILSCHVSIKLPPKISDDQEFVAFGPHPGPAATTDLRVVTGPADRQRLAVDQRDEPRVLALAQPLHQGPHQHRGVHAAEAARQGRGAGQPPRPQGGGGPVPRVAGPLHRPLVQGRPEEDQDDDVGLEADVDEAA